MIPSAYRPGFIDMTRRGSWVPRHENLAWFGDQGVGELIHRPSDQKLKTSVCAGLAGECAFTIDLVGRCIGDVVQ